MQKIYLGGGCFWGLQDMFRDFKGVVDTVVGYSGGSVVNPTYQNHEGHAEVIEVTYDPSIVTFSELLDLFFRVHNPTTKNRQGNDVGTSYRSVVFYQNEIEKKEIEDFISLVDASGKWKDKVMTTVEKFDKFYTAEEYHQDYLIKNPGGYTCHELYFEESFK